MHYYVYDSNLDNGKEYARFLAKIETELNNLGLTGERTKITNTRKIDQIIVEAAQKQYNPIVIVGDDEMFSAAASALAKTGLTNDLAYIPSKEGSVIANLLGVTQKNAVVTISRRQSMRVPLASANGHYFLAQVKCGAEIPQTRIDKYLAKTKFKKLGQLRKKGDSSFTPQILLDKAALISSRTTAITIKPQLSSKNLKLNLELAQKDGWLKKPKQEQSTFWPQSTQITSKPPVQVSIDGRKISRTPLRVSFTDSTVNLIVGSQRELP